MELSKHAAKVRRDPVKLTFKDIEFEVPIKLNKQEAKAQKTSATRQKIIKGVSGFAMPGQSTFILGSSGAGKTSLLNILSDRASTKTGARVSGKVMINDTIVLN